jgi:hypothetical protein
MGGISVVEDHGSGSLIKQNGEEKKKVSNETLNFRLTFLLCRNMVLFLVDSLAFSLHVA